MALFWNILTWFVQDYPRRTPGSKRMSRREYRSMHYFAKEDSEDEHLWAHDPSQTVCQSFDLKACRSSTDLGGVLQYAGKMDLIVLKQAILFQDPSQL